METVLVIALCLLSRAATGKSHRLSVSLFSRHVVCDPTALYILSMLLIMSLVHYVMESLTYKPLLIS